MRTNTNHLHVNVIGPVAGYTSAWRLRVWDAADSRRYHVTYDDKTSNRPASIRKEWMPYGLTKLGYTKSGVEAEILDAIESHEWDIAKEEHEAEFGVGSW